MAWLARIDTRASQWPPPFRWPYLGVRWGLILVGAYLIGGLALVEIHERRVGLGTGVITFMVWTYAPRLWRVLPRRHP